MKKRFTEEQVIGFLREAETGLPIKELFRQPLGWPQAANQVWSMDFVFDCATCRRRFAQTMARSSVAGQTEAECLYRVIQWALPR